MPRGTSNQATRRSMAICATARAQDLRHAPYDVRSRDRADIAAIARVVAVVAEDDVVIGWHGCVEVLGEAFRHVGDLELTIVEPLRCILMLFVPIAQRHGR